jgi:hypothetical protein
MNQLFIFIARYDNSDQALFSVDLESEIIHDKAGWSDRHRQEGQSR